jgi:hypothetical protein
MVTPLHDAQQMGFLMYQLVHSALFTPLYASLRPVRQLPWSVLQLDVRTTSKVGHKNWNFASEVERGFFEARSNLEEARSALFAHTNRLVLNYGHEAGNGKSNVLDSMIEAFKRDISYEAVPLIMTKPERMWVARVQDGDESDRGWKLVYDSRDGLSAVEDAVLEVVLEDDMWKAKFLPDRWIWHELQRANSRTGIFINCVRESARLDEQDEETQDEETQDEETQDSLKNAERLYTRYH